MATIEIDGKTFEAENGKMIIEVADDAGIYIPRFCYHKKLSVAANCRMCLVEVENGRKPVPACATPITNGMKVFTKSEEAVRSQQAVMEFLLINHPLDCPICDQGGECELQDISMGFGEDASHYMETKRSVNDDELGPLISTEMTRCIHCTRCVRFGEEIAGIRELGTTGRGEDMQIGTYVKHSMQSELSGNIIDLCPVGALTSKPYRFSARPWELNQHDSLAPHDCLGSNIHLHVRSNELMRVVPKENEQINETWLSDRDRFSYLGVNSNERALQPKIRRDGQWETVDWPTALKFAAEGLARVIKQYGAEQVAAFASPSSSTEELYLLQKMMRELGVNNLDHRLQQIDFRDQFHQPLAPTSSLSYAALDQQQVVLLLGANLCREVPLAAARVRKLTRNGAKVYAINPVDYEAHFTVEASRIIPPQRFAEQLGQIYLALTEGKSQQLPEALQTFLADLSIDNYAREMAEALKNEQSLILSGALIENHPEASWLRTLISMICEHSGAKHLRLTQGANSAGACYAGMLPHRTVAGKDVAEAGLSIQDALAARLRAYLLLSVEPGYDIANPANARQSMLAAEFVVLLSAFENESMYDYADVILPIAAFPETSGTYVNVDKTWQTVKGALTPKGEARPAWKVLRVLANLLHCQDFEYSSTEEILAELNLIIKMGVESPVERYYPNVSPEQTNGLTRVGEWPLYRIDATVRHAKALQDCAASESACIRVHPETANRLKLEETATVSQADIEITLPLKRDERVAPDVIWVANALPETVDLGHSFAGITIKR